MRIQRTEHRRKVLNDVRAQRNVLPVGSDLTMLSHEEKDALIVKLWSETVALRLEVEHLRNLNAALERRLSELENKVNQPAKDSSNSSIPPSKDRKKNKPARPTRKGVRRASIGRKGGGRPLDPNPDQQIHAKAKTCPHCGRGVSEAEQHLHAVYDKIEIPPVKPIATRVHQYGGHCGFCDQDYVSPVPQGMEPGSPFGASIQALATYYRYTHAISYERPLPDVCRLIQRSSSVKGRWPTCFGPQRTVSMIALRKSWSESGAVV